MITRTRYKEKIDPHAVAMDMEIEVTNEVSNYLFRIDIEYVPNNEIALFIFGRRGEGHVDPQIIDNINYYEKIKIPEYKSFMAGDRRKSIGMTNGLILKILSTQSKIFLQIQTLFRIKIHLDTSDFRKLIQEIASLSFISHVLFQ